MKPSLGEIAACTAITAAVGLFVYQAYQTPKRPRRPNGFVLDAAGRGIDGESITVTTRDGWRTFVTRDGAFDFVPSTDVRSSTHAVVAYYHSTGDRGQYQFTPRGELNVSVVDTAGRLVKEPVLLQIQGEIRKVAGSISLKEHALLVRPLVRPPSAHWRLVRIDVHQKGRKAWLDVVIRRLPAPLKENYWSSFSGGKVRFHGA